MAKKMHHTVPKMYLKYFANNNSIQVYNKSDNTINQKNINKVSTIKNFYLIPSEVIELFKRVFSNERAKECKDVSNLLEKYGVVFWEELLSMDENRHAKVLCKINKYLSGKKSYLINEITQGLDNAETKNVINNNKTGIANFMALQVFRTKDFRSFLNNITDNINEPEFPDSLNHMMYSNLITDLCNNYKSMLWRLYINNTEKTLLTSDNPVIRVYYEECIGLLNTEVEIKEFCLPLSPNFMFCFFDFLDPKIALLHNKSSHNKTPKRSEILDLSKTNQLMLFRESDITYYNQLQIFNCSNEVFCINKNDLTTYCK